MKCDQSYKALEMNLFLATQYQACLTNMTVQACLTEYDRPKRWFTRSVFYTVLPVQFMTLQVENCV